MWRGARLNSVQYLRKILSMILTEIDWICHLYSRISAMAFWKGFTQKLRVSGVSVPCESNPRLRCAHSRLLSSLSASGSTIRECKFKTSNTTRNKTLTISRFDAASSLYRKKSCAYKKCDWIRIFEMRRLVKFASWRIMWETKKCL